MDVNQVFDHHIHVEIYRRFVDFPLMYVLEYIKRMAKEKKPWISAKVSKYFHSLRVRPGCRRGLVGPLELLLT